MNRWIAPRARRGLTLLELVAVMAILAVIIGMIVPRLDFFKDQADHVAAAGNSADLFTMVQAQKISSGSFPSFDLLVGSDGTAYSKLWSISGTPPVVGTQLLDSGGTRWYSSFLESGLKSGYYQLSTATDASNSAGSASTNPVVDLTSAPASTTGLYVAELDYNSTSNPYVSTIFQRCFPDVAAVSGVYTPPSGTKLIAMGIGPRSSLVGNTVESIPLDIQTGDDPALVYSRYIAIFAIYSNGKAAQLKMVVDHRLKQVDKRLDQYRKSSPTTGV